MESKKSFTELLTEVNKYKDTLGSTPSNLVREILARIDESYKLVGLMWIGGEGILVSAIDALQSKCVLKIAHPVVEVQSQKVQFRFSFSRFREVYNKNDFRERFIEGCRLQAQLYKLLAEAPCDLYVPAVRKVSETPGLYVEMEHLEGINILRWVKEKNSLKYSLNLFCKLLRAVQFFHGYGIVHRDLKTDNIMICGSESKKEKIGIVDWTLSKLVGDRNLTIPGTRMGTVPFISPKLLENAKDATYPDDIFALGFVLYEFVQQDKLPKPINIDIKTEEGIEKYRRYLASLLPPELARLFLKATEIEESKRFQTTEEFLQEAILAIKSIINDDTFTEVIFDTDKKGIAIEELCIAIEELCNTCTCTLSCKNYQVCKKIVEALIFLKKDGIL